MSYEQNINIQRNTYKIMHIESKEEYVPDEELKAFYTGGEVAWLSDGSQFLCQCETTIQSVDIQTGKNECIISNRNCVTDEDPIYTFALSHNNIQIVTAHKSGLIKLWARSDGEQIKMWRHSHKGPVSRLSFDYSDEHVASGGSDGNVRLWNLNKQTCIGSLRGALGVFNVLKFHPNISIDLLFGSADDTKIRSWHCKTGKESVIYSGHFSKVTSVQFTLDGKHMISSGRDRVIILWDLKEGKSLKTLPVYECIEGLVLLPDKFIIPNFKKKREIEGIYVAAAGEKGIIKVWNLQMDRMIYEQSESLVSPASEEGGLSVVNLLFNEAKHLLSVVTSDHNIIMHDLETFDCVKQMIGFSDEVLDVMFLGDDDSHLVVATNSADLKCYNLNTMNCEILKGHTDIVLTLDRFPTHPNIFISSGKDNSVRIWCRSVISGKISCLAVGTRHTASVGAVYAARTNNDFFVSVSQDNCLKYWQMPKNIDDISAEVKIKPLHTEIAHTMDINSVAISPNDKVIATGSQDKTAKLYCAEDLSHLGTLKGHRRGIWCVRFSPVDQVILTSSADSSIKLWSLTDLICLKTLEGHESSVLKTEFLCRGTQIISSGADGLLKLWSIKTSECIKTMDKHDGKVWALALSADESTIFTGGSDSKMVKWKDVTAENREKRLKEREETVLLEQEFFNLLNDKKMLKALKLALRLERPMHVYRIINDILKDDSEKLKDTLNEINEIQKEKLLHFAAQWNTNTKYYHVAQIVFNILSTDILCGKLHLTGLNSFLEGSIPYSERHYDRLTCLLQDLNILTYTINCMEPHALAK